MSQTKRVAKDVKDAAKEAKHRTKAGAEHLKRKVAGREMTGGQKVRSFVREDVENTKADVHKAKRKVRDSV